MTNPTDLRVVSASGPSVKIPGIVVRARAPTISDRDFPLYQRWIDTKQGNREYILIAFSSSEPEYPKTVVPIWAVLSYASYTTESLVTDDSVVVGVDDKAQIKLKGNSAQGITTSGSALNHTATINAQPLTLVAGTGISITKSPVYLGESTTIGLLGNVLSLEWIEKSANFLAENSKGYFVSATATAELPVSPVNGTSIAFITDGASTQLSILPSGSHAIKVGAVTGAIGQAITNSGDGNSIWLVYRSAASRWEALSVAGGWVV